ncbi:unnamed protein product [Durusdinium trenchii]|uniref:Glycosyl transferase family 25 domain-containing protein n=1 Tax=Durusdinium trenchii TaxID=1381693 RepID=A0ABP0JMA8_9DINO
MTIAPSCGCKRRTVLYQIDSDSSSTFCRHCFLDLFGRHPSPSFLLPPRKHERIGGSRSLEIPDDRPWQFPDGSLCPKLSAECPASTSVETLVARIETEISSPLCQAEQLADLICLAGECVAWLHAETMVVLSESLVSKTLTLQSEARKADEPHKSVFAKNLLRTFLRSLAKHAQPCHGSDYVSLAGELQLVGLAHGDFALRIRAEEAAEAIRVANDLHVAADLFWVYLTAKAPEKQVLESLESIKIPEKASQDAMAAILCGLAQPQVLAFGADGLGIAERFAKHLIKEKAANGLELPAQTIPRLALALSDLIQSDSTPNAVLTEALQEIASAGLRLKQNLAEEDLADLAVSLALSGQGGRHSLVEELVEETFREASPKLQFLPGAAVKLIQSVGTVPAGTHGVLGEFYLSRGQWRVWLDNGAMFCVDVREESLQLLDNGLRPHSCCYKCWSLSRLWNSESGLCENCAPPGSVMTSIGLAPIPGLHDLSEGSFSARSAARLASALVLSSEGVSLATSRTRKLLGKLRRAATDLRKRTTDVLPFMGPMALSMPNNAPQIPVFVVNLDRSPHRLKDMRHEVQRCGLRARRMAATDGRHRVVRRSRARPYLRDLTSFALRWDEARPAIGVAMTAAEERHFVGYVGSWLSHTRVVRQGLEEGSPFVVVLEDDQVLNPDMNSVMEDIISCAGDILDIVILGPLDWRLRSLQYAQPRKIMQLRHPLDKCTTSAEEEYIAKAYGYRPKLQQESSYFLYSIGSRAMTGEDVLSTGCCGVWGYMVSRKGAQKMEASMKFMWESFDDVLQAELQGDNRFTSFLGRHRLWAVWPPLVTSDGKWPSQNSGEDLDFGKQHLPVSPHAGFRDHTLQTEVAQLILCSDNLIMARRDRLRHIAAATALVWPPVEPIWAYVVNGWRRLFTQRAGAGGGFELRTEAQHKMYKERRFFDIATEGLTWSWTVLRAAFLFDLAQPSPTVLATMPPEGPPQQLPPLALRILWAPMKDLLWCPSAWFRDLMCASPGSHITFHGRTMSDSVPSWRATELRQQLPQCGFFDISVELEPNGSAGGGAPLVLVAGLDAHDAQLTQLLSLLELELAQQHPVLVTAKQLQPLLRLWTMLLGNIDAPT